MLITKVKNDLFDYPNRYIMQLEDGFKFSLDSILLAEYVNLKKAKNILDMCTGNAPIPLILSTKTNASIVGFEIQEDIACLGIESVAINNLDKQIKIINDDIKNINNYYNCEFFDIITCNPPFFKTKEDGYINKNDYLTIARHEITINLEIIFEIAFKYLRNNGSFYMVNRSERLDDIIYLAKINKLPVKEIQLITTKKDGVPNTVIVKCVKNGNSGIKFKKVICVEKLKTYQNLFE